MYSFVTRIEKVTKRVTNMINANIRLIFDRKGTTKGNKDIPGLIQIEVRLIGGSKRIFITTNKYIAENQFTYSNGNFTCKNDDNITKHIRSILRDINAFIISDKCNRLEDVKNYNRPEIRTDLVVPFIESEIRSRGLRLGTIKQHRVLINKLNEFDKIRTFADLTYNNIDAFDKFIRQVGMEDVTAHKRHSIFNSYIREAVRKGLINKNPYDIFKPKRGKPKDRTFLTEEELNKIIKYKPANDKMQHIKDMFLFQCFTGMAYSDMAKFDKSEISKEGKYEIIRSSRTKTDERFVTLLLPEAKSILEKYDYRLPVISNQKYNDYLKILMEFSKINKQATSHTARHTYAVYLLNKGVPIEAVSVSLGHADIRQTQHYAKLLAKSTINSIAEKLLKGKKK